MKQTNNIKILVLPTLFPSKGNKFNGIFVKEQVLALVQNGLDVSVFYPVLHLSYKTALPKIVLNKIVDDGITVYYLDITAFKFPTLRNIMFILFSYPYLCKLVAKEKYDLIHSYLSFPSGFISLLIGNKFQIPFIITEVVSSFNIFFKKNIILFSIVKKILNACEKLITVSDDLGKQIMKNNIFPKRMRTLYTIADENIFYCKKLPKRTKQEITFLFTGFMHKTERKGIHILIEAVKLLNEDRSSIYNFKFIIVGDGDMRIKYENRIKEYNLSKYFQFLGNKTLREIANLMQQSDIFILPSLHEGLPCVIVEALSCGMPIIASRVGGIPEIVKENCGVLVQPNSINDLKEKILYMLDNYNNFDKNEISKYAHKLFNYKAFSSKMIKEYKDTIANYQA